MKNEITTFTHEQFGSVRALNENNTYWFVATDVCTALALDRTAIRRLDADEKGVRSMHTLGGDQTSIFVNEAGLYSLVLGSRKPEAKAFKRWITHEVIPTIRKTGGYVANSDMFIDSYFAPMDDSERAVLKNILETSRKLKTQVKELNGKIEEDAPKVLFANAVTTAQNSILVGELAKLIKQNGVDMGQKRLFQWLKENGYLIKGKRSDQGMPTQRAMEMGLFEIKETVINHSDGTIHVSKTVKVTGKGQQYFVNKFLRGVTDGQKATAENT